MNLLLVSATYNEIEPLLKKLKAQQLSEKLYQVNNLNCKIDILISGIGMVSTTYYLTKHLAKQNNYQLAINAGIAGSFKPEIDLGKVVNVVSDCFADLGAEDGENLISLTSPLASRNKFGTGSLHRRGEIPSNINYSIIEKLMPVNGITVNMVSGNETTIAKRKKLFNPDVESMEGAAFFYCCMNENIPCYQIRSISNYVERRNKKNWKIKLAIQNLNDVFLQFFPFTN